MNQPPQAADQPTNPLVRLWNVASTLGGIITLSSMAESWYQGALEWRGFISTILESYRSIVYPAWELMVSWLPLTVPTWVADYLAFGLIVAASHLKGSRHWFFETDRILFVLAWLLWPLWLIAEITNLPRPEPDNERLLVARASSIATFQWLAAIVLGVVILLAINAQL